MSKHRKFGLICLKDIVPEVFVFLDNVTADRSSRMICEVYTSTLSAHIQTNAALPSAEG